MGSLHQYAAWNSYPGVVIKVKVTVTKIEIQFPLINFSLLWPIDTKLGVWLAYMKAQLWIATQVSVIKVKVTVTKIEIQFLLNNFTLLWPIDTKLGACNHFFFTAIFHFLFLSHQYLVELLKTWFRHIAALLVS